MAAQNDGISLCLRRGTAGERPWAARWRSRYQGTTLAPDWRGNGLSASLQGRLAALRRDYRSATGTSFQHFFCPILRTDDEARLCRAHVINQKFDGADPAWTVQRADVDAWFGSLFEKDFLAIEQRGRPVAGEALLNRGLAQRFRPEITVDGQVVAHYPRRGRVPEAHTAVDVNIRDATVSLALRLTPSEVLASRGGEWEVRVQKDVRVQALVSVLKAAHLTMFHLLGYRYALSGGGRFLGMDVLGTLFLKSQGMERPASLTLAKHHLRQFSSMVRPVIEAPTETPGTITDRCVHFLMRGHEIWGCLVFVRTANHLHAAVVPILESPESASLFARFLESPAMRIETRMGRFGRHAVELSPSSQWIDWPEAPFDV